MALSMDNAEAAVDDALNVDSGGGGGGGGRKKRNDDYYNGDDDDDDATDTRHSDGLAALRTWPFCCFLCSLCTSVPPVSWLFWCCLR